SAIRRLHPKSGRLAAAFSRASRPTETQLLMDRLGVVADQGLGYRGRNTSLVQQRRSCSPKRVKRKLFNLSECSPAFSFSLVIFCCRRPAWARRSANWFDRLPLLPCLSMVAQARGWIGALGSSDAGMDSSRRRNGTAIGRIIVLPVLRVTSLSSSWSRSTLLQ